MRRYGTTRKKVDKSGKRVFGITYYPQIPLDNSDRLYTTIDGERIENIAFTFYEDETLWWVIAKANGIKGKTALKPGENLRIPLNIQRITENFRNINKSG